MVVFSLQEGFPQTLQKGVLPHTLGKTHVQNAPSRFNSKLSVHSLVPFSDIQALVNS